jgi:hypothetical protein
VKLTRLSCHRFRWNELWLGVDRLHLWRQLVLPQRIVKWSLTCSSAS